MHYDTGAADPACRSPLRMGECDCPGIIVQNAKGPTLSVVDNLTMPFATRVLALEPISRKPRLTK